MRLLLIVVLGVVFASRAEILGDDEFLVKPNVTNKAVNDQTSKDSCKKKKTTARPRKCFRCKGSGSIIVAAREKCSRCDGTGIFVTDIVLKDTIHKTGVQGFYNDRGDHWTETYGYNERGQRVSKNRQPCPQCKRQGSVPVKKSVECSSCKGAGWLLLGKPFLGDPSEYE